VAIIGEYFVVSIGVGIITTDGLYRNEKSAKNEFPHITYLLFLMIVATFPGFLNFSTKLLQRLLEGKNIASSKSKMTSLPKKNAADSKKADPTGHASR